MGLLTLEVVTVLVPVEAMTVFNPLVIVDAHTVAVTAAVGVVGCIMAAGSVMTAGPCC